MTETMQCASQFFLVAKLLWARDLNHQYRMSNPMPTAWDIITTLADIYNLYCNRSLHINYIYCIILSWNIIEKKKKKNIWPRGDLNPRGQMFFFNDVSWQNNAINIIILQIHIIGIFYRYISEIYFIGLQNSVVVYNMINS